MNKRSKYIIAGLAVFTAVLIAAISLKPKTKDTAPLNPSRRDDTSSAVIGVGDEDLSMMVGDKQEYSGGVFVPESQKDDNKLENSILDNNVNKPLVDEVQIVRRISLTEAVSVGDGDADAFYDNEDFKDVIPVDAATFSAEDLPAKFDSRNVDGKCYVTDVEDQGYTYLCWAFASLGACESDILKHHDDISSKDLDLSEKHMAYYNVHKAEGSRGGLIDGDYRELVNADGEENAWEFGYDTGYLSVGGVNDYCISILTAWKGPVIEKDQDAFTSIYGNPYIFTDNTQKPSDAFSSEYHVQGAYEITAKPSNITSIKQMITEHGSVSVGVDAGKDFWKDHKKNLYSDIKPLTANHEVLIIGWDDDYSAANFGKRPEGDGAWICKNSWGSNINDKGYFYLSYYDKTAAISNVAAYHVAAKTDADYYDNNYQTAGFFTDVVSCLEDSLNTVNAYSASSNPYGMLYTAQDNEQLRAIGFMSLDQYQQYELDVFLNPEISGNRIEFMGQDAPVLSQKIAAISGGYHTFELDKEIDLEKGDEFFVLLRPVTQGRLVFERQNDFTGEKNYDEWKNLTGNIHNSYEASGLSFYISDDGLAMDRQNDKDFFIKAYTVNR